MGSIFKKFGQGLLYILVLPAFLLAILIFGVYGIFLFIVLMIKSIICFFKGKSLYEDLPEDIEAQRRLHPERAEPKVEARIEEREEYVIVDRGSERHGELEDRGRPAAIREPRREEIPLSREDSIAEEEPDGDDEEDDTPVYDETDNDLDVPSDDDVEEITISELEDEEEEDIPTLKTDSKISDGDDDDDSSDGVSIADWRK